VLTKVKELASEAFGAFLAGTRIPICRDEPFVCPAGQHGRCPKFDVAPQVDQVIVTFRVPGATSSNTKLIWDSRLRTLSLYVASASEAERHRAVLGFAPEVEGSRGAARLTGQTLTVHLPRNDRDTLTGLPAWWSGADVSAPLALCS